LAVFTGTWFLLGEAIPRALLDVTDVAARSAADGFSRHESERPPPPTGRTRRLCGAGTIVILAGQIASSEGAVRGGALIWLGSLALLFAPLAAHRFRSARRRRS
jgi:hypothetical protein